MWKFYVTIVVIYHGGFYFADTGGWGRGRAKGGVTVGGGCSVWVGVKGF